MTDLVMVQRFIANNQSRSFEYVVKKFGLKVRIAKTLKNGISEVEAVIGDKVVMSTWSIEPEDLVRHSEEPIMIMVESSEDITSDVKKIIGSSLETHETDKTIGFFFATSLNEAIQKARKLPENVTLFLEDGTPIC